MTRYILLFVASALMYINAGAHECRPYENIYHFR